jgi:hypothetical protein
VNANPRQLALPDGLNRLMVGGQNDFINELGSVVPKSFSDSSLRNLNFRIGFEPISYAAGNCGMGSVVRLSTARRSSRLT